MIDSIFNTPFLSDLTDLAQGASLVIAAALFVISVDGLAHVIARKIYPE